MVTVSVLFHFWKKRKEKNIHKRMTQMSKKIHINYPLYIYTIDAL